MEVLTSLGSCAHLMLDGAGTIMHIVAVDQHIRHLAVPEQCDVVPLLGLRKVREECVAQCFPALVTHA